jgi:hypothetical protein
MIAELKANPKENSEYALGLATLSKMKEGCYPPFCP